MYCQHCGAKLVKGSEFCSECGNGTSTKTVKNSTSTAQKSKLAAGLLQIFLGGLGIGRFYLGYTGIAIAQLLVTIFTCGLGGIWPFIDGILILAGNVDTDANGNPLSD